jgi:hypothetical protein
MAFDESMPTPDGNQVATMTDWEAYWVGGLGGAAGVIAGKGGELAASINSGARTVSAASGAAMVRGFYVNNPSTYTASVPAHSVADRVDRLVLRLDRTASVAADWLKPVILQGTSGSASPPALAATDAGSWDLPVARWTTKADGSLTGFADERQSLGGSFMVFKSTQRPAASPPRLGYETDTGRLLFANGSAWSAVTDDTGFITVKPIGNWTVGGYQPQIRRVGSVVYLRGSMARTTNTLQSTDTNSPLATIDTQFRPVGTHNYSTVTSTASPVRIQMNLDGSLALVDLVADIPVGRAIYIDTMWMVGP